MTRRHCRCIIRLKRLQEIPVAIHCCVRGLVSLACYLFIRPRRLIYYMKLPVTQQPHRRWHIPRFVRLGKKVVALDGLYSHRWLVRYLQLYHYLYTCTCSSSRMQSLLVFHMCAALKVVLTHAGTRAVNTSLRCNYYIKTFK